ncbi:Leukocyte cell-derived chemotaxin 1 [Camelus dromedarius]|uniref:Leukocyte cell-derived chemotaxin 1 n=1 Tax=Camelus dromedarius TaxID=9838 RepID=A0A5N4D9C0_CAMDR|nr:Leukocyte cell-derived chemotaxin 1 [Camelus dromedarius]
MPSTSGQQDRAQGVRGASQCPTPAAAAMTENSDKVPIALVGPDDVEFCSPPAYATVSVKPSSPARLLKVGAVVLISGAVLLLFGAIGAFYFWKGSDNHIYNVHYTVSINGKLQDGSMEIDAGNNLETFTMGSGAEEAIEVNDFQNEGKIMPVKYEENSLIWVAVDQPVKDNSFLSSKVLELCGHLPIFWLKPTYPKAQQRDHIDGQKSREEKENWKEKLLRRPQEDCAVDHGATQALEDRITKPDPAFRRIQAPSIRTTLTTWQQEGESMTFDPRLDHEGICCIECRRSYTHCQKICEPLGGYYPWPYNYQGCRSACRVVMPCSWWVARILGMV